MDPEKLVDWICLTMCRTQRTRRACAWQLAGHPLRLGGHPTRANIWSHHMVLFCFSGKLGVEKTMRVVARLPTASFAFNSLVEDLPTHPGCVGTDLKIVYSEQNLKSDVRNANTALGVDVPRTKPELPQAGPGWEVRSGGAGGGHPFFRSCQWGLHSTL